MKLAPASVPYRVLQKSGSLLLTVVFLVSVGTALPVGPLGVIGVLVAILGVIVAYEVAYYRRFRYELTDDTFDLSSGVFNRREREIPYGRIQNVDISRNVLQRLVGLSAVNIETAGGGSTEAVIEYVTAAEGERLQRELRRSTRDPRRRASAASTGDEAAGTGTAVASTGDEAAGTSSDGSVGVNEVVGGDDDGAVGDDALIPPTDVDADRRERAEEELLFELAPSELLLVGVLSFDLRVPGVVLAVFTGSVPFVSPIVPPTGSTLVLGATVGTLVVGTIVLTWLVGVVSSVVNYWGFRLTRAGDELRYERGLLQRYSGTIPFGKIQAMTIEDNPLKRRAGYATLAVETAGYAPGQASDRGTEAAVPLARRDRVDRLAAEIDAYGTPAFSRPPKRIRRRYLLRYLLALGLLTAVLYALGAFVDVAADVPWFLPAIAAVFAPLAAHYKWRHRGYWLGEDHVVTRNGFWDRETKVVAYYRIQTVIDSRTVFQRRWNVATVVADTAGSLSLLGTDCAAVDVDADAADTLRAELTARLQRALADRRGDRQRPAGWVVDDIPPAEDDEPVAEDDPPDGP